MQDREYHILVFERRAPKDATGANAANINPVLADGWYAEVTEREGLNGPIVRSEVLGPADGQQDALKLAWPFIYGE